MILMDFSLARLNHQIWKMRLKSFLDGKEELTEAEAGSHTECDLGQWLYSTGLKKFDQIPEMHQLEKAHAELHTKVKRIVKLKHTGQSDLAKQEFKAIVPISDQVISLLGVVERKVK